MTVAAGDGIDTVGLLNCIESPLVLGGGGGGEGGRGRRGRGCVLAATSWEGRRGAGGRGGASGRLGTRHSRGDVCGFVWDRWLSVSLLPLWVTY